MAWSDPIAQDQRIEQLSVAKLPLLQDLHGSRSRQVASLLLAGQVAEDHDPRQPLRPVRFGGQRVDIGLGIDLRQFLPIGHLGQQVLDKAVVVDQFGRRHGAGQIAFGPQHPGQPPLPGRIGWP